MISRQFTSDKFDFQDVSDQRFFERLHARVEEVNSLLCIGLDPHVGQLKNPDANTAIEFCLNIISKTFQYAAAYKPNAAFFEAFGPTGIEGLIQVIRAIPDNIPVILDVKRGDIETTAQAYADAAYGQLGAGAVTLSPYMGWDSIAPFVTGKYASKAAFVLCKTSNSSSKELQEQRLSTGKTLYEEVATMSEKWNAKAASLLHKGEDEGEGALVWDWGCIGLVAGATDVPALKRVRTLAKDAWILCPGVGAQGGDAESVCAAGLRADGSGLLVSVSRGISAAPDMATAAETLRDSINELRRQKVENISVQLPIGSTTSTDDGNATLAPHQRDFLQQAMACGALQFGSFVLKSGRVSPYFFNAGLLCSGLSFRALGRAYSQAVHEAGVEFDVVFGPAYKGIPLATALAMSWAELFGVDKDVAYNRKEAKDHGEGGTLVGASVKGRRVLIVDDVITAGTAIREALGILEAQGAVLAGVVVALDRQEFGTCKEDGSAIQQVHREQKVPVMAIVQLQHLVSFVADSGSGLGSGNLDKLKEYRSMYGVEY